MRVDTQPAAGVPASTTAAGGLLFNVTALPGASFVLAAGLAILGFLLSLGLPHSLVLPNSSSPPTYGEPANRTQT